MSSAIRIGERWVGAKHPPFVIAEMSGNHNGSLERALTLVDAAARAGADALKLQTYTADTMTLNLRHGDFVIHDPKSLWTGRSLYELYQEAHTPWEWHAPIFERARSLGLLAFSTPFDDTAVDFLDQLAVPCFKIASFENTDLPLIAKAASKGKPLIISTGMATEAELAEAVETARAHGCRELILLKCTSAYPASPADSNLATIPAMRERFGVQVGLSDHTLGIGAAIAAVSLGATVVEKHFTIAQDDGGVDSAFSLTPEQLASLVREARVAHASLGRVSYGPSPGDEGNLRFRRALYAIVDIPAGAALDASMVRALRPAGGLEPKHLQGCLSKRARRAIARGTALTWDLLD